jgi:Domain of unknown function (DUF4926)
MVREVSNFEINELDTVVLTHNIPEQGLKEGDLGAVVHCYSNGVAFEVEFIDLAEDTTALVTLTKTDIRPVDSAISEINRTPGLHRGNITTSSDSGATLPDQFWLGES